MQKLEITRIARRSGRICNIMFICMSLLVGSLFGETPEKTSSLIGDGKFDNSSILQRFIDVEKQPLILSKGVYRITQPIKIQLDKTGPISISGDGTATLLMDGPGPAIRFIGTHEGTAAPATVKANVWSNQRTPMVDGIEILGGHSDACGIEASGTMQLTVTRVVLRKLLHGIHLIKRNRNVLISNCHIYENSGVGIFYDHVSLHQSNIIGCHISYNKLGGIVNQGGDVRNIHIGTCDIEGNMGGPNSPPSANIELDCRGGSVAEVAIVGCTIQHDHVSPNSANIRFHGESTPRPFTTEMRHGHLTIADNVLSDVHVNIELTNARSVTVSGNTVWKGFSHNLKVSGCESVVISGNMFDRNPRYHYGDGADSRNALLIEKSQGITFTGNHITAVTTEPAGLVLKNCQRVNVTNSTLLDCQPVGILLEECRESRISGCLIVGEGLKTSVKEVSCEKNVIQIDP